MKNTTPDKNTPQAVKAWGITLFATIMTETKELYIRIRDDVADQIIQHGLSKTESKLFFYFLKLDRFSDRPAKVKVAEILLATGVGKTAYHAAIAKFESLGWFDFKHSDVEVKNLCSPNSSESRTEIPEKRTENPESRTEIPEKRTGKANRNSGKAENRRPKPAPEADSSKPHTIQTYSDFTQTLSEDEGERFKNFCNYRIAQGNLSLGSRTAWLNAHHQEYWAEFQEAKERDRQNQERLETLHARDKQVEEEMGKPEYKAAREAAKRRVQGFGKEARHHHHD